MSRGTVDLQKLNIDKMLEDLIDVLSALDGRVRKLELRLKLKRTPSYLKVVAAKEKIEELSGEIRSKQIEHSLTLLKESITNLSSRLDTLEHL